jgi:hypothetical protein
MSFKQQMQNLWSAYTAEHGEEPSSIDDCFEWAKTKKLWTPRPIDVRKIFRREMADALRDQMRTDASGRKYRAKLCVRESSGGIQLSLWGDADLAPQSFVERSVRQRRDSLVDDAYKLKQDVDHFNEFRTPDVLIQLVLDLTMDVAEREALQQPTDDEDDEKKSG